MGELLKVYPLKFFWTYYVGVQSQNFCTVEDLVLPLRFMTLDMSVKTARPQVLFFVFCKMGIGSTLLCCFED